MLHLSADNNLHDCLEDLADVDINNCDIVKDYKKLGKRKMVRLLVEFCEENWDAYFDT